MRRRSPIRPIANWARKRLFALFLFSVFFSLAPPQCRHQPKHGSRGPSPVSRAGGCNSSVTRSFFSLSFPSRVFFSFRFFYIACLGHRPPTLFSFLFARSLAAFAESHSFHRSCVLSSKVSSLTPHALACLRISRSFSHTLSFRSTVRVCSRRSIHIASLFRFASRERLASSLSQWFREQV